MNQPGPRTNPEPDPRMIEMLAGMNAAADREVVQRTRRSVMQAAAEMRERRRRNRRNLGIALMAVAVFALVLTPAIWSSVDEFTSGGDFLGAHSMMMVLSLILFSTVLGALLVGLRGQRPMSQERR